MESISQKVLGSALLLAVLSTVQVGECARILGVFPITSVSHQVVYRALMMELARRGHELVVITPDPINDPSLANYTEIDVSFMYDYTRRFIGFDIKLTEKFSSFSATKLLLEWGLMLSDTLLDHEPVRRLISPNNVDEHFDLVFVEWLQQPSTYGFAYRFSAPMIGISSLPPFGFCYDSVGNPTNPSYIPEMVTPYSDRMTFFERLDNFIYFLRSRQFYFNYMFPKHDVIAKRSFGPSIPNLMEMHYNASMLFVTYEPSFHSPRPDVPAIVHLTGLHLKPPKPLPQDLQQYLDSAPKGVIYFSLGSNVRSDKLDANTLQMFLEAFAELDGYHVLWKWESDKLPGQPANVKVLNWTPQQDILRHPKVKAFIMQGGLQSTEEAIHSAVPIICIPFFIDQEFHAKRIVDKGIGLKLDISEVSKEKILESLRTVLQDESYQENVRRLSAIVKDKPRSSLDNAVWWTEYALRHKGAAHLRTAAVDMPWYQYLLLDVVAFLIVSALLAVWLLWRLAAFVYSRLVHPTTRKLKKN